MCNNSVLCEHVNGTIYIIPEQIVKTRPGEGQSKMPEQDRAHGPVRVKTVMVKTITTGEEPKEETRKDKKSPKAPMQEGK